MNIHYSGDSGTDAERSEAELPDSLQAWLKKINTQDWRTVEMTLDRMHALVDKMDLARPARHVITVAGTNGKGTTCHACERLLLGAGYRVGTTLSPHIDRFNERIRIDGEEVGDAAICHAFAEVERYREDLPLTYFEYSVLATLYLFAHADLDFAILEIGLGGRLDAFNAIDADTAIITSIGLDHQAFLGDTREAIGAEKAGILRANQRVFLGRSMPNSVLERCAALNLEPRMLDRDFSAGLARVSGDETPQDGWVYAQGADSTDQLPMGASAISNLALAYAAVNEFDGVTPEGLAQTSAALTIRGRLERRRVSDRTVYLDVAHNPDGIDFLIGELAMRGIEPQHVYCGMLEDKDHAGVAARMHAAHPVPFWFVSTHGFRAFAAADLADAVNRVVDEGCVVSDGTDLVRHIESVSNPGDVILAFGSFNIVEQFLLGEPDPVGQPVRRNRASDPSAGETNLGS